MIKVLVVEDEEKIARFIELELIHEGYKVIKVNNGREGLEIAEKGEVDLVLLDVMLPELNGLEVLRRLRKTSDIPVIMLTARDAVMDKVSGLDAGADDYITKPFNPLEIIARVNSNLRRFYHLNNQNNNTLKEEETKLVVGDLVLDKQKLSLFKRGEEIIITPTEYKILSLFMKNPGKIFTKLQMSEAINGDYLEGDNNTMMVHISRLREKIEDDSKKPEYIKTVRGIGYKIEKK